ncbi:MAG: TrbI F-type domain-containing protein [Gammaproteobacteria bacterium]
MPDIVKKIRNFSLFMNDSSTTYAYSFMFGMLGALFIFMIVHIVDKDRIQIGTVNITGIVDQFIKQESEKNLQPDILKKEVKHFGSNLNKQLQEISKEKNIILMPSEAIIAGSRDFTSLIYQRLQMGKSE